jgi:hypothetical protein
MAEKLPVIIDNRGDNTVLRALQRLLPNLQRMDVATGVFEVGSFLLLEGLWQDPDRIAYSPCQQVALDFPSADC